MQPKLLLHFAIIATVFAFTNSCNQKNIDNNKDVVNILIETDLGNIKAFLYNETPKHRDNFVKNIEQGVYDGVIFHRVIENFMIQGGDPATGVKFGGDSVKLKELDTTIDAEFVPGLFHKKGVLAAARMGDNVNPLKQSSSTQFYIVQGKVFTPDELKMLEFKKNENAKNTAINNLIMDKAEKQIDEGINPNMREIYAQFKDTIEIIKLNLKPYNFSEEQINIYATLGGTPHLDSDYTVFGEVTEGFDVIDKIAAVKTGPSDKPLSNVRMKIKIIK